MPYSFSDSQTSSDIGLIVTGKDLPELFADAAIGLTAIMAEPSELAETKSHAIEISADNLEDLYVAWLNEVIYLKDAESFLVCRCLVDIGEDSNYSIKAKIFGELINRKRHTLKVDIKAVTYYKLSIVKKNEHWEAEVVLDL